jgi:hypothetical protein
MKRLTFLLILVSVMLAGCASHDYVVKNSELYLSLKKPDAKSVYFASSLDGFSLHKTERLSADRWQIIVPAGNEIKYFYIIDGVVYIPSCRFKEMDDFGTENCIYVPGM